MKKINIALIGVLVAFMAIGLGVTVWAVCLKDDKSEPEQSSPSQPNMIEITYDLGCGVTFKDSVEENTVLEANEIRAVPTNNVLGCELEGWYSDSACTTEANFTQAFTKDTTLYAKCTYVTTDWFSWTGTEYKLVTGSTALPSDLIIPAKYKDSGNEGIVILGGAFINNSDIVNVILPNTITELSEFGMCGNLKSVTIPASCTAFNAAFYMCPSLTEVIFEPNSQLKSITGMSFHGCSSLTSITIPASVTECADAFSGCASLANIVVEEGNAVYDSRNNCNAIIETATNTLLVASKNTIIPNTVTTITGGAFSSKGLTNIIIPASVTSIEDGLYVDSSLTSIVVEEGNTMYDSRNNCNAVIETATNKLIWACSNAIIPNTVTIIGEGAFSYYTNLTSIIIPASVTTIEEYAFAGCSNLESVTFANNSQLITIERCAFSECTGLTSITIPAGVTSIGNWAFSSCSMLINITIPASVTSIGSDAFSSCDSLTITMGDADSTWKRRQSSGQGEWATGLTSAQVASYLTNEPSYYYVKEIND